MIRLLFIIASLLYTCSMHRIVSAASDPFPLTIEPNDSRIAELYIAFLDRDIELVLQRFDLQAGLIQPDIPENATAEWADFGSLTYPERRTQAEEPRYLWSYGQSRKTAELAGAMAYAYTIQQSKWFQSKELLNSILSIFRAFSNHQTEEGEFVFSPIHYSSVWGTHEMAWRLEPLLNAYTLIQSKMSPAQQKKYRDMLERGIHYLSTHEQSSLSNRGMVWCGVMALCSRFTGEEQYRLEAERVFQWVKRIFAENGEIREGPGPDLGYSTISLQYLFLYRLMTGNTELDAILIRSLEWYTRLFTFHAVPLEGMTTRQWLMDGKRVSRVLGVLTFYANRDPSFQQIATRYLEALMDMEPGFVTDHGGWYFLSGCQYHIRPEQLETIPYKPYAQLYKSDHSLYYLVGRNYQTSVTLRGRKPLKGLQTWSYQGEPPLIFPSKNVQSTVKGYGFASHLMDAPWNITPLPYKITSLENEAIALIHSQGDLYTAYLFSTDTTVVVYRSLHEGGQIDLAHHLKTCAEIENVNNNMITFYNSAARIILPSVMPKTDVYLDTLRLRIHFQSEFCWLGYAGPNSSLICEPVYEGLVLVQILKDNEKVSVLLNLSGQPFTQQLYFPGTKIPIPPVAEYGAYLITS